MSEAFATRVADERLLPSVPPEVSPEVRCLSIHLGTVWIMADVFLRGAISVACLSFSSAGAVWAGAHYVT